MLAIKRVYDEISDDDGYRILVDRLWPRGLSKSKANINLWIKELAPSSGLRRWFHHDLNKWEGFHEKYTEELKAKPELLERIKKLEDKHGTLTLLYGARDQEHNNAVVLRDVLLNFES